MVWCDRKDGQLPGDYQPHSRLTGTTPQRRPTQLTARYAAVHAKKVDWGRSIRLRQQLTTTAVHSMTSKRRDSENLGYKPKHEIGGDLVEGAAHSNLDFGCVLGDSNFGKSPTLRRRLRK